MLKTIDNNEYSMIDPFDFEDEIDCAIMGDEDFNNALEEINDGKEVLSVDDGEEDLIDVYQDYSDDRPALTTEEIDANYLIAAERDLAFDPFGEEELIDAATESDKDIDDMIFEDEEDEEE